MTYGPVLTIKEVDARVSLAEMTVYATACAAEVSDFRVDMQPIEGGDGGR